MTTTLLWFRQDLRLQDNPALAAAVARGGNVVPVYIFDPAGEGRWAPGGASRWWLHQSLAALDAALQERGSRLILAQGDTRENLLRLIHETRADGVCWNRRYEPGAVARDAALEKELRAMGLGVETGNSALLNEPETIANKQGNPFQVFTPYWRHCMEKTAERPQRSCPERLSGPERWPASLPLEALGLQPKILWAGGLAETWTPGVPGAVQRLKHFAARTMAEYAENRNLPDRDGSSMLSPCLHFGEISPRQVWATVARQSRDTGVFPPNNGARVFLSEIGWREFAYHLLRHFPHTPEQPLREEFARFPWAKDPGGLKLQAWQRGLTGYPIVDAGMRQLWYTGWMHNRVRMITASFLVKHLRLPWTDGAAWFWDTLVDADLASNTLGWQWTAGCGADAAPYFRIFAPVLQGEKFDGAGDYVRRWVPELAKLPAKHIHAPWTAPAEVLQTAGVKLGGNYPRPIVDHAAARAEALAAFKQLRGTGAVGA